MGNISQTDAHKELRFVSSPLTVVNRFTARMPENEYLSSAFKFSCVPSRPSRGEGHNPERKHSSTNLKFIRKSSSIFLYLFLRVTTFLPLPSSCNGLFFFLHNERKLMIQYARLNPVNVLSVEFCNVCTSSPQTISKSNRQTHK